MSVQRPHVMPDCGLAVICTTFIMYEHIHAYDKGRQFSHRWMVTQRPTIILCFAKCSQNATPDTIGVIGNDLIPPNQIIIETLPFWHFVNIQFMIYYLACFNNTRPLEQSARLYLNLTADVAHTTYELFKFAASHAWIRKDRINEQLWFDVKLQHAAMDTGCNEFFLQKNHLAP